MKARPLDARAKAVSTPHVGRGDEATPRSMPVALCKESTLGQPFRCWSEQLLRWRDVDFRAPGQPSSICGANDEFCGGCTRWPSQRETSLIALELRLRNVSPCFMLWLIVYVSSSSNKSLGARRGVLEMLIGTSDTFLMYIAAMFHASRIVIYVPFAHLSRNDTLRAVCKRALCTPSLPLVLSRPMHSIFDVLCWIQRR